MIHFCLQIYSFFQNLPTFLDVLRNFTTQKFKIIPILHLLFEFLQYLCTQINHLTPGVRSQYKQANCL